MMPFRYLCSLLTNLFLFCTLGNASLPHFVPATGSNRVPHANSKLRVAFADAILLARVAATTFSPCDEVFLRYFRPEEADFVKHVFMEVANIQAEHIDAQNVESILSTSAVAYELHEKFSNLEIALGDHPEVEEEERLCGRIVTASGFGVYSYTTLDFDELDPDAGNLGQHSWQSLCEEAFDFPFLWEVELLATDLSGHVLPGHTCAGLGDRDSDFMDSPGGILLHELMHWTYLLQTVDGFSSLIEPDEGGFRQIRDYSDPNGAPVNGLGASNAMQLKNRGQYAAIQNADNFKWYALSKYWSWRCGRAFGPALSDEDVYKRGPKGREADPEIQRRGGGTKHMMAT